MARPATRQRLARNRHRPKISRRRPDRPLAHAHRRGLFRPGGGQWPRLSDRSPCLPKAPAIPADPFQRGIIPGTERVLCLDEATGKILWHHDYDCPYTVSYPAGPRATPLVSDGKVYTLGAEGNLLCLDANRRQGPLVARFQKGLQHPHADVGFLRPIRCSMATASSASSAARTAPPWRSTRITGKEIWRALDRQGTRLLPAGDFQRRRQAPAHHLASRGGQFARSRKPAKSIGPSRRQIQSGMTIPTPRQMGDLLFLTCFYNGSMMLQASIPTNPPPPSSGSSERVSEKNTDALHSTMSTPFIEDGYIYGVCSYGQLRCLKADTGERVWETLAATTPDGKEMRWANAFIVKNGDRFFLVQRKGRSHHRETQPQGLRGNQPRAFARTHQHRRRPRRRLVASRLRQPLHVRPQRQGNHLRRFG